MRASPARREHAVAHFCAERTIDGLLAHYQALRTSSKALAIPDEADIHTRIAGWMSARRRPDRTLIVGIDGAGGAGKSTVAAALADKLGAAVVAMDDFYRLLAERRAPDPHGWGSDFDHERLRAEVLEPLVAGRRVRYGVYDWHEDRMCAGARSVSCPIVLVEGIYVLQPRLRGFFDLAVWIDAPREERLRRGLERDGEAERATWEQRWMPQEDRYMASVDPRASADLILDGSVEPPTIVRGPTDV